MSTSTAQARSVLPRLARRLAAPNAAPAWRAPDLPDLIERIDAALSARRTEQPPA